ncbi:MAG: YfhO family protein, partial [Clostridiales bacterium]|nr:YfhO family protein [Clostridiales bacterium]
MATNKKLKESVQITLMFVLSSMGAVLLDAFLLLPVWKSLSGSKAVFTLENLKFVKNFGYTQLLPKLFTGSGDMDQISKGMPNIYVGMIMLVLFLLYFTNRKIGILERILSAVFVGFLCVNFCIDGLNLIWHGLNYPTWFPYRYSFVLSFLMIYLAYRGFVLLEEGIHPIKILIITAILLGMAYLVYKKEATYLPVQNIRYDVIVILVA